MSGLVQSLPRTGLGTTPLSLTSLCCLTFGSPWLTCPPPLCRRSSVFCGCPAICMWKSSILHFFCFVFECGLFTLCSFVLSLIRMSKNQTPWGLLPVANRIFCKLSWRLSLQTLPRLCLSHPPCLGLLSEELHWMIVGGWIHWLCVVGGLIVWLFGWFLFGWFLVCSTVDGALGLAYEGIFMSAAFLKDFFFRIQNSVSTTLIGPYIFLWPLLSVEKAMAVVSVFPIVACPFLCGGFNASLFYAPLLPLSQCGFLLFNLLNSCSS